MQNRYYSHGTGSVKHFMSRPELLFISQLEVRRRAGAREGHRASSLLHLAECRQISIS